MPDLQEISFDYKDKKYTMRQLSAEEDLFLQKNFLKPDGQLEFDKLVRARISKAMVSPTMSMDEVGKLPLSEFSLLQTIWFKLNDVDQTSFLEIIRQIENKA